MNNQKGEEGGIQHERSFGGIKKKKTRKKSEKAKQPLLCWVFEVLLADTGVQTHKSTQSLSLTLSLCFLLSFLSLLPLSSLPHPFIFTLGLLQGSPLSPSTYHSFAVQALISVRRKINSILWIHFSSYHGFNNGNKAKAFQLH